MFLVRKGIMAGVVLAAVTAIALPCRAEESAHLRASALAKEGGRLYDQGDYEAALAKFQEAYDVLPSPKLFYNYGLAYSGLAREAEALDAFQRFLAESRDAPRPAVATAEQRLKDLRARVPAVTVTSYVVGASILVDGRPRGTTPLAQPLRVDRGPHQIVVEKVGYLPFVHPLNLSPGAEVTVNAVLVPVAPAVAETVNASEARGGPDLGVVATPRTGPVLSTNRSHAGQLGVVFGTDIATQRAGAVLAPGLTLGLGRWVELEVAALLGSYWGGWAGGQVYFLDGALKPGVVLGVPLFRVGSSLEPGVQVGPRLQWDPNRHVGAFVDLTAAWFPGAGADLGSFWILPRVGVQARL